MINVVASLVDHFMKTKYLFEDFLYFERSHPLSFYRRRRLGYCFQTSPLTLRIALHQDLHRLYQKICILVVKFRILGSELAEESLYFIALVAVIIVDHDAVV